MKALALVALVACGSRGDPATTDEPEPAPTAPKPVAEAPTASPGYLGVLTPRGLNDVVSPFTSSIAEIKVQLGDQVKRGQVLGRFDDRSLKQSLAAESSTLRSHEADVSSKKIQAQSAQLELEREKRAYDEKLVPKANVDQAELKVRDAQAAVQGAIARYEEQRANVAKLTAKLTDATMHAPADGRVALLFHREGERVEEGQAVLQVISSDDLYIKFAIPGDKVGTMAAGDEVDVVIVQQNIKTRGVVRHVQPALDSVAQMILAEADLAEPQGKLQSGQRCRILPRPSRRR